MTTNFAALRRRFPLLGRKTYLNSGSYGALADSVRAAIEAYLEDRVAAGADWEAWMGRHEAVRAAMARMLGAACEEIAVTASASAGINALASALDFTGARNQVVVSDFEFPTHAQIWHAQERLGAQVVHVPVDADRYIPLENFARVIDERTQLVAVTQICYRNGARLDIAGLVRLAHERGARLMMDCYQSVGAMRIDVRQLQVDFAVGGMLKYLLGTAGIGFLYVRSDLIDDLIPAQTGWLAQRDIAAMDILRNSPSPTARRFEAGTPSVVSCYAAEAGLEIVLEAGTDAIERRIRELTRRCLDRLENIGWPAVTPAEDSRRGPMVAIPSRDAAGLVARLLEQDVVTSHRDGNVRASIHCYNNEEDIDRFVAILAHERARYGPAPCVT